MSVTEMYKCLRNNVRTLNGDGIVDIESFDPYTQVTIELPNDKYIFTELNGTDNVLFKYCVRPNFNLPDYVTIYENIVLHDFCCGMFYDNQFVMSFTYHGVHYRLFYRFFDVHNIENCGMLVQLVDDTDGMVYDFDDNWSRNIETIYNHVVVECDENAQFISSLCENDI